MQVLRADAGRRVNAKQPLDLAHVAADAFQGGFDRGERGPARIEEVLTHRGRPHHPR
jgi:hypothetical protein